MHFGIGRSWQKNLYLFGLFNDLPKRHQHSFFSLEVHAWPPESVREIALAHKYLEQIKDCSLKKKEELNGQFSCLNLSFCFLLT